MSKDWKVYCTEVKKYTLDGEYLFTYKDVKMASEYTGISCKKIYNALKGNNTTKYIWKLERGEN